MTAEMPPITEVEVLRLRPNDLLLVRVPDGTPSTQVGFVIDQVAAWTGLERDRIVVVENDAITLEVLRVET